MKDKAIVHYEAALIAAFPKGASGDVFHHWNEARKALEQEKALQALHNENERLGLYKDAYGQPEPEPVAWATHHEPPMFFYTKSEAALYCDYDESPIPVYTSPPKREPLTDDKTQKITKSVAEKCADIADTAEPYRSGDLIRKHFGIKGDA